MGCPGVALWDRKVRQQVPHCIIVQSLNRINFSVPAARQRTYATLDSQFFFKSIYDRMLINICIINESWFTLARSLVIFSLQRYSNTGGKIADDCQV